MPVLEATTLETRSALRHRPLTDTPKTRVITTTTQRASRVRPKPADDELVGEWQRRDTEEPGSWSGPHRVTQRGRNNATSRTMARRVKGWHTHPVLVLGLGMLATLVLWTLLSAGLNWWNDTMDYLHYGYPRSFQIDAVVGHTDAVNNPSHFLATNLHGRVEIVEFPGGDGAHARIYLGPQLFGPNVDKAPVTLQFADVNGDHAPDMLVFFQQSWIVLMNDQGSFRTATLQERQDAVAYLTAHGQ